VSATVTADLQDLAAQFPVLKRRIDGQRLVYLDSSATSQTPQPVIDTMTRYYTESRASIHRGVYPLAVEATELYEGARRAPGLLWLLLILVTVVVSDAAALLVGMRLGRHPFFPAISPKKTVEGAVAELLASTVFFGIVGLLLNISFPHNVILGLLIGVFAEVGDLVESQIKRTAGVKDASQLIPGHGGVLDRIDSLLLVGVVVYYYVTFLHLA